MLRSYVFALIYLVPGLSLAQEAVKTPSADAFRNEALVFEKSETTYKMLADGTGERDAQVVLRIQSEGAAQKFGVLSFSYASANETPKIKLIRVHKADGATVDTPPDSAIEMPAEVSREAPLYSDLKEKHVPVRSLAAGDTLEYEVDTHIDKAETPGQFWGATHFAAPGTVVVLAEVLTLQVPADKYVQVWSPNHKSTVTEKDGVRTYTWNVPQVVVAPKSEGDDSPKVPAPADPDEDADGRKVPSVAWTTFHSWAEVGNWYRGIAQSQSKPNDALRARADEIVKDAKTPEDQVRALYNFVSTQNRYVGIDFGIGRYQPHAAAEVLANQYGDCKDKDTLLEALLQAKGFSTAPALIGAGIAPVADVPSPAVFNHVITTVNMPAGRIWLDSTPGAATFRYLVALIRDQKALIVPPQGDATLEATPADPPYPLTADLEAVATLDAEGKLAAKMTSTNHDDDEIVLRALARAAAPAERDKVSQLLSRYSGFGGTTSNTQFKSADDTSQPIVITYDYARHPYGDWDNLRILPLFGSVDLTSLSSDTAAPEQDIQLGAPRTLTVHSRIRIPDGYDADIPDPVHVKTDFATFDATYRLVNGEVVADRKVVVLKRKVLKSDWKKYQAFTKDTGMETELWIQLYKPGKSAVANMKLPERPLKTSNDSPKSAPEQKAAGQKSTVVDITPEPAAKDGRPSAPSQSDASATELLQQAAEKMRTKDWDGAKELLDQAKQKDPNAKGLWGAYGMLAEYADHDVDQAKADFRKEVAVQPGNYSVVGELATLDVNTGDSADARRILRKFLDLQPDNLQMAYYLSSLQTAANDDESALKTLQSAAEQHADDRILSTQIGEILVRLHRNQEAAAAARSALDGSDDPEILNDGADVLSGAGLDLALGEEASRKCIAKLEEESASSTTAEANSKAFARANLLVYSWDTLGWILYREGKIDEAEPYLAAGWRASLRAEIGDHLGQLYEAAGKKQRAYDVYALAEAAVDRNTTPDAKTRLAESVARLRPADTKPGRNLEALQALRTYKITKPAGASGWGTFRLEITSDGVIESQQMSGEKKLDPLKPTIGGMKFPELLPPGSKAHLLRSAVISCTSGNTCEVVLVPDGGLQTELQ
jgi:Flp pilus assembly protein TadD